MSEQLVKVRVTEEFDGYTVGQILEVEPGIADAFVVWRQAAEYVAPEPKLNKMMKSDFTKKK